MLLSKYFHVTRFYKIRQKKIINDINTSDAFFKDFHILGNVFSYIFHKLENVLNNFEFVIHSALTTLVLLVTRTMVAWDRSAKKVDLSISSSFMICDWEFQSTESWYHYLGTGLNCRTRVSPVSSKQAHLALFWGVHVFNVLTCLRCNSNKNVSQPILLTRLQNKVVSDHKRQRCSENYF